MYCNLNDAYNDTCDLTQSGNDCVYDNIVNDGVNVKGNYKETYGENIGTDENDERNNNVNYNVSGSSSIDANNGMETFDSVKNASVPTKEYIPRNMFTAQGDYQEYSPISKEEELIKQQDLEILSEINKSSDAASRRIGTPIASLKNQVKNKKQCTCKKCKCYKEDTDLEESLKKKNQENNKTIEKIVKEQFKNMWNNKKSSSNTTSFISADIRDGILITFIGIMILFLLDILVRISKKL